jgi:hypothetical protein
LKHLQHWTPQTKSVANGSHPRHLRHDTMATRRLDAWRRPPCILGASAENAESLTPSRQVKPHPRQYMLLSSRLLLFSWPLLRRFSTQPDATNVWLWMNRISRRAVLC